MNVTHSPWWDNDRSRLAKILPHSSGKEYKSGKLAWVPVQHFCDDNSRSCTVTRTVSDPPPKQQSHRKKRGKEQLKPNEVLQTRKLALYLSSQQKQTFHRWFGICRHIYNRAVDLVAKESHKPAVKNLQRTILPTTRPDKKGKVRRYAWWRVKQRTPWLLDNDLCPHAVKKEAINEYIQAVNSTEESLTAQNKNPNHFEMHHRSRKDKVQTVTIPKHGGSQPSCWLKEEGVLLFQGQELLVPRSKKAYTKLKSLIGDKVSAFQSGYHFLK